jgi:cytidylate kinase
MQNNKFVLLITGPSGAGKSTVARQFAEHTNSIVIDIEHINFMFVGGFQKIISSDDTSIFKFNNWELAGQTIGLLAKHFTQSGRNIVIHGHVNDIIIKQIESVTPITHKILLLPEIESVILRDKGRGAHLTMGEAMVRDHHNYFSEAQFESFITIDSTRDEVVETVAKLISLVEG